MLIKIAFQNARKNIGDFTIYFITLSISIAILFAFISVYPQIMSSIDQRILESSIGALQTLSWCMNIATIFVFLMFSFLFIYANLFFLKKRKKEFGLYLLLGLNKLQVGTIFLFEIIFVSIISFIVGIFLGIGTSQLLGLLTSFLFTGSSNSYLFFFSWESLAITIIYFAILFIAIVFFGYLKISRSSILSLLNANKSVETTKIIGQKKHIKVMFVISLILLAICYFLMVFAFLETCFIVFILGSISGFLFFYSFSIMMFKKVRRSSSYFYKGLNPFVIKEISSQINTSSLSLAFVSLSLILTVFLMSLGFGVQFGYTGQDNWFGFVYIGIYMGVSFMIVSSAILAIRQLSNIADSKERYVFLKSLGADETMIKQSIFKQVFLYFAYPFAFASLASIFGLVGASLEAYSKMQTNISIGIIISLTITITIYSLYFAFTYISSKKTLLRNKKSN